MAGNVVRDLIRGRSDLFYPEMAPEYRAAVSLKEHMYGLAQIFSPAGHVTGSQLVYEAVGNRVSGTTAIPELKLWYKLLPHEPGGYYVTVSFDRSAKTPRIYAVAVVKFTEKEPY